MKKINANEKKRGGEREEERKKTWMRNGEEWENERKKIGEGRERKKSKIRKRR